MDRMLCTALLAMSVFKSVCHGFFLDGCVWCEPVIIAFWRGKCYNMRRDSWAGVRNPKLCKNARAYLDAMVWAQHMSVHDETLSAPCQELEQEPPMTLTT